MNRPLSISIVAAALFVTAACSDHDSMVTDAVSVTDSSGVRIITNDLTRLEGVCSMAPTPRLRLGNRPEDPAHDLFRVFGATMLSDGRVALVDQGSQGLKFFSPDGAFLLASGREGEGPGEFRNAFLLWRLPGDTLWVGDYRPWEFEVFAPNGEWVRVVRPEPRYANPPPAYGILSDGRTVLGSEDVMARSPDFQVQPIHLALHDQEGILVDTVRTVPNGRWGKTVKEPNAPWLFPWFESFAKVAAQGDRLIVGHGATAELQVLRVGEETGVETIIRWTVNWQSPFKHA